MKIGEILKIPTATQEEPPSTDNFITYTVVKGDSLYSIAKKYNTTVDAIKDLNNLSSNLLNIGQTLKIPTSATSEDTSNYKTYTVVSGDSLYSIAKKYNTTVDAIKDLNNLSSNLLNIGQTLKIPTSATSEDTSNYKTYTVVSGDSLYSIAKKYNTTVDAIKDLNNLSSNLLSIGQILKIPANNTTGSSSKYITYKVVSGDSLYSIAKKYNTTVNVIKDLNSLSSNLLSIGQTLKIPLAN